MNYIIPDGFDFYKELKNEIDSKENAIQTDDNLCLIDGTPLKETSITLDCGHKFNYVSLLNDVYEEKYSRFKNYAYYSYSSTRLYDNQLRCPYCRQIQENILPYLPDIYCKKIRGVNYPPALSMGTHQCDYIFKSGKNKGKMCSKKCYRKQCNQHYKPVISYDNIERTDKSLKKLTLSELKKMAKHYKLKKYSTLKKNDLIKMIINI